MLWMFGLCFALLPLSGRASELGNRKRLKTETGASSPKTYKRSLAAIPFQLTDGLVFIQAKLNGAGPLWMMLETGSSVTMLDESVSMMLGVPFVDEGSVYGPGQGSGQRLVCGKHATLSFGEVEVGDQTVSSVPLGRFSRELGRGADGFLGSNAFSQLSLKSITPTRFSACTTPLTIRIRDRVSDYHFNLFGMAFRRFAQKRFGVTERRLKVRS
jgi:hypothetical protein